jgi:hypothetical protein
MIKSCGEHLQVKPAEFCPDLHGVGVPIGCGRWSMRPGAIIVWNERGTAAKCKFCGADIHVPSLLRVNVDVEKEVI